MALNIRQQAFIEHYLACWNATEAARRAGYSEKSARKQGSRMSTNVDIQTRIQARLAELKMGADEVLTRISDTARGTIADFIDIPEPSDDSDQAGNMIEAKAIASGWRLNLAKAKEANKLHLIKKLKAGQWGPEIELYDAQAAQQLIARHHGLFVERTETTIDILGDAAATLERKLLPAVDASAETGVSEDADDG